MAARLEGSKLLIPLALLLAAGVLLAITAAGSYLAALPLLMSPTADVAFILFALAFAASSLARLLPNAGTRFLLRNRRYLGLGFAMVHFTHLALVLSSITLVAGQAREPATLVPGVIAYAFLALMTVTSNDASVRRLGPRRWRRLHRVGSYYIWLIFLATTLPPSAGTAWMLLACLLVLALRIGAYQRATGKKLRV